MQNEYSKLRTAIENSYKPGIDTVYFIRPPEDFFVKKYGLTRSWDEFGVPSTFFEWVPPYLIKQIVFEKTKSRLLAEKLVVKHTLDKADFSEYASKGLASRIYIDATEVLK